MSKIEPQITLFRSPDGRESEIVAWGPIAPGDDIGWHDISSSDVGFCDSFQVEGNLGEAQCSIHVYDNTGTAYKVSVNP